MIQITNEFKKIKDLFNFLDDTDYQIQNVGNSEIIVWEDTEEQKEENFKIFKKEDIAYFRKSESINCYMRTNALTSRISIKKIGE